MGTSPYFLWKDEAKELTEIEEKQLSLITDNSQQRKFYISKREERIWLPNNTARALYSLARMINDITIYNPDYRHIIEPLFNNYRDKVIESMYKIARRKRLDKNIQHRNQMADAYTIFADWCIQFTDAERERLER